MVLCCPTTHHLIMIVSYPICFSTNNSAFHSCLVFATACLTLNLTCFMLALNSHQPCVGIVFCSKLSCEPLVLPGYTEGVVIQPGLFKGTYGDHGLELVLLTYEDNDSKAVITKITVCTSVSFLCTKNGVSLCILVLVVACVIT